IALSEALGPTCGTPLAFTVAMYGKCELKNSICSSVSLVVSNFFIKFDLSFLNFIINYKLFARKERDRKSTRLNSSHVSISYAVFCLKKKKKINQYITKYIVNVNTC